MAFGLVLVEDLAGLRAVNYLGSPSTRRAVCVTVLLAILAGAYARLRFALPWPLVALPGGLGVLTVLGAVAAQLVGHYFPQTWWFRSDCIHILRGPLRRRIRWEAISRWRLAPHSDHPGSLVLTIWHDSLHEDGAASRTNTIIVPAPAGPERIEQVLDGYTRVV